MIDRGREVNHPALRKALESPTPRPGRRDSARGRRGAARRDDDGQIGAPEADDFPTVGLLSTGAPTE